MTYYRISELDEELFKEEKVPIIVQARLHHSRKKGNLLFLLLRDNQHLLQVVCFKKAIPDQFKDLVSLPRESILRVEGNLIRTPMLIETTGKQYELSPTKVTVVSQAEHTPIQIEDLNQMTTDAEGYRPGVSLHHRLNLRYLDLRSNVNQAIFRVRAGMEQTIREFLIKKSFTEIHTPKLIGIPSESGSSVFEVKYFDRQAYLAQSPQLYKQMMINSDFGRVFEIGAVYRAEKSISRRHLCEFTGLDLEMELHPNDNPNIPLHYQVFEVISDLLKFLSLTLSLKYPNELELLNKYYPGDHSTFDGGIPVMTYEEGAKMLTDAGHPQDPQEDLNHEAEQKLGDLVKEQLGRDIFWLESYPTKLRPFYTMYEPDEPNVTRSYDLIYKGQEIASGAQRINDYQTLLNNMKESGLTPELYQDYLESFRYGSPPHAGIGIGLERLVALYLNIPDVHCTSLLPRDPERLTP